MGLTRPRVCLSVLLGSALLIWGLRTPIKSGELTPPQPCRPQTYGLGGDAMSKAQAQKHRAVSLDAVLNTQITRVLIGSGDFFFNGVLHDDEAGS